MVIGYFYLNWLYFRSVLLLFVNRIFLKEKNGVIFVVNFCFFWNFGRFCVDLDVGWDDFGNGFWFGGIGSVGRWFCVV